MKPPPPPPIPNREYPLRAVQYLVAGWQPQENQSSSPSRIAATAVVVRAFGLNEPSPVARLRNDVALARRGLEAFVTGRLLQLGKPVARKLADDINALRGGGHTREFVESMHRLRVIGNGASHGRPMPGRETCVGAMARVSEHGEYRQLKESAFERAQTYNIEIDARKDWKK